MSDPNPKHEARNPKQIRMMKYEIQSKARIWNIWIFYLDIVSDFDIRI